MGEVGWRDCRTAAAGVRSPAARPPSSCAAPGAAGAIRSSRWLAALELAGAPIALLSAGTDGIDGPTDAAGAFVDGQTLQRARELGLDPRRALADNDSLSASSTAWAICCACGPTGTNVMDLKIAVGVGSAVLSCPVLQLETVADGYLSEIFLSFQGEGTAGRAPPTVRAPGGVSTCAAATATPPTASSGCASFRVFGADGVAREHANPVSRRPRSSPPPAHCSTPTGRCDGIAFTGGEPLLQAEFLAELLADARWPRPRLLETNGMLPDSLRSVLPLVDVVSMDIKLPSNSGERAFWDAHARFLAIAGDKAYVKVLVDAGTDLDDVERAAAHWSSAPARRSSSSRSPAPDGRLDVDRRRPPPVLRSRSPPCRRRAGAAPDAQDARHSVAADLVRPAFDLIR